MKNFLEMLENFKTLPDGTYDINKNPIKHDYGFQVSFHQIGKKYSEKEYNSLVKEMMKITKSVPEFGIFEGNEPHVSFWVQSEALAKEICKKYFQLAYWDWKYFSTRKVNN